MSKFISVIIFGNNNMVNWQGVGMKCVFIFLKCVIDEVELIIRVLYRLRAIIFVKYIISNLK